MGKPKVYATRVIPQAGFDLLAGEVDLTIWPGEMPPPFETLLSQARGMDGLITLLTDRVDARLMEAAGPGLKVSPPRSPRQPSTSWSGRSPTT